MAFGFDTIDPGGITTKNSPMNLRPFYQAAQHECRIMSSIFDGGPVSLPHLRMVKHLADLLAPQGEKAVLPAEHHQSWAAFFESLGMTAVEAEKIGK